MKILCFTIWLLFAPLVWTIQEYVSLRINTERGIKEDVERVEREKKSMEYLLIYSLFLFGIAAIIYQS